ncbi:ComEA family DNA-binding protein [Aurantibacter sp.]|uniref:ComEA family DNA-binding protein n=1 Tax=Aurantibacter sp. TaxID=2807103 RepID=UPI0035C83320
MNIFKSHIVFSKQQRYGIFLLLIVIAILQGFYFYIINQEEGSVVLTRNQLEQLQRIDSLKQIASKEKKYKIYPFNPNYINDYKGYQLGMSLEEIDRLLAFRKQNKWVNSAKDFQKVTNVSDSLLGVMSPYFKFPDWVTSSKTKSNYQNNYKKKTLNIDINKASAIELQAIYGIGESFSERIITYRNKFEGGFASLDELYAIYGLTEETITQIKTDCFIGNPRAISTLNINTATRNELVKIPFIDYEIAFNILEYRTLHEKYSSLDELLRINNFPNSKIKIIKLYLHLN